MQRTSTMVSALACVVACAGCGKRAAEPAAATAGSGSSVGSGSARVVTAAAPPPDDKALDAAIAAKGFQPTAVRQRKVGATSAWAVVAAPRNANHVVVELDIIRVRADGVAVLPLTPIARKAPTWWDVDVPPLDVRDLDGDGRDECLVVLSWVQDIPNTTTGEGAQQLYVIGGDAEPKVAFTAIVDYTTQSQQATDHDKTDPPPAEHIAYEWRVEGKPPVVSLKRTEFQLNKPRAAGLTDPATEPLLAAGDAKTIALELH
jgi:ABC-type amino acid transport substrate-binding protein